MDYGAYLNESPRQLRELVRSYPGIKPGISFFDDEFNSIASWVGSDESVQAKYVPRGFIYNLAAGVKTFVWLLAAGTDDESAPPPLVPVSSFHGTHNNAVGRCANDGYVSCRWLSLHSM